jgi:RNA-directed DNA polymerase
MRYRRGGSTRSSDDGSVMELERRGRVIESLSNVNPIGEERTVTAKPFDIPKRLVWNAWRLVRANRGAAGVDEESLEMFEGSSGTSRITCIGFEIARVREATSHRP